MIKYEYPEHDIYKEGSEVFYSMTRFMTDQEIDVVWAILDQAIKRENLKLSGLEELSIRVYDSLDTGTSRVDF